MNEIRLFFTSLKSYPREFWVLCIHMFLFMSSFSMLIPEMNDYLTKLGGEDYKWMIMGLWTLAAGISRPLSGKIADNISRKSVMYFGVIVSIVMSFIYPFFTVVSSFLLLRFLHGFSTGFQPTGASALVADLIPKGRRGEAMGIFGVTFTLGFSVSQVFSSTIKDIGGINGLFYACGIMGLFSLVLLIFVKEDRTAVERFAKEKGNNTLYKKIVPRLDELFGPEVIVPAVVMFLTASLAGMYFMLIPDLSVHLGYENKGLYWILYMVFTIFTRIVAGRLTDKYGARNNLYIACIILAVGAALTGTAESDGQFLFSSVIYGIGSGISSPAIFSWTADLANPAYKGRGMGTMFIALEFGILSGTFIAQQFYMNKAENIDDAFFAGSVLCIIAFLFLLIHSFVKRRRSI